jgi:hypothetical protein
MGGLRCERRRNRKCAWCPDWECWGPPLERTRAAIEHARKQKADAEAAMAAMG